MQWNMETVYTKKQWNGNGLSVMDGMDGKIPVTEYRVVVELAIILK